MVLGYASKMGAGDCSGTLVRSMKSLLCQEVDVEVEVKLLIGYFPRVIITTLFEERTKSTRA
jgi:hypothetical protein